MKKKLCVHTVQESKFIRSFKSTNAEFKGHLPATCSNIHAKQSKASVAAAWQTNANERIKICYFYSSQLIFFLLSLSPSSSSSCSFRNFHSFSLHSLIPSVNIPENIWMACCETRRNWTKNDWRLNIKNVYVIHVLDAKKKKNIISSLLRLQVADIKFLFTSMTSALNFHSYTNNWNAPLDWFLVRLWLSSALAVHKSIANLKFKFK